MLLIRETGYDWVMRNVEPGLMSVFRLFTGLRLAFGIVAVLAQWAAPDRNVRLIEVIEPAVLMFWLLLPLAYPQYEGWLLPVALVFAGVGPLITQADALHADAPEDVPMETILTLQTWSSMIVLLLPVVITAWQYRFKQVALYSIGITLLNVLFISLSVGGAALESTLVTGSITARAVTFMVIGWLLVRLMTAQRSQRQELTDANLKLMHHSATLEQLTITRERNRLARELHDTLAHTLSALAVQLEAVDALWPTKPDQAHARLEKSIEMTRSGLTETRRVLQDLRASPLEDLGLALALRNLVTSTAARAGLEPDLHIEPRLGSLSPDIEQAVYRITQEALVNVVNHANAQHLTVQLGRFDGRLTLTVSDDGSGFAAPRGTDESNGRAHRLGIRGMRERAELVGGQLEVESQPGQGTIVMFSVRVADDTRFDL
jgi:signal transduction histidine kinase